MATHAAVVLAAGKGTRMKSQTPKVLHQICGREMLNLAISSAQESGLSPIVTIVPQKSDDIREAIGDSVKYAVQSEPLGTGHALLQARDDLTDADNIVVMYGDVPLILPETLERMVAHHNTTEACITILTSSLVNPDGLGRIVRSDDGAVTAIVEEEYADDDTRAIQEINSGFYCFRASWLWPHLAGIPPSDKGEVFLTDLIALAVKQGLLVESIQSNDAHETMGVNNRVQLAEAEGVLRQRIREHWMLSGVTMPDPSSVYIDSTVELGNDCTILPNTHLTGQTIVGAGCHIGPNAIVSDSTIGDQSVVLSSVVRDSIIESHVDVGPFSHVRGGSRLESGVHVGTSAEVNRSQLGQDTKMGHFSYMGDARLGKNVNIGAGSITCNFDGEKKNVTVIGDNAFIGCDTMLVAPRNIGEGAYTGTGSVVTKDVPSDTLVVGIPARPAPRRKTAKSQE